MPRADVLLSCHDLRLDVAGVPTCDGLTLATTGQRVLVLGAPLIVFRAAVGLAPARRGTLAVCGRSPGDAVREGLVAGAATHAATPAKWSLRDYVTWSARLSGAADPVRRALQAIDELQLGALRATPLGKLVPHARRAAIVAAALATGAKTIALEDPLGGLPDDVATTYAKLLVEALSSRSPRSPRSWVVFAPRMPLGLPLASAADEAIVVGGGVRVDAQGAPTDLAAATRRYLARLDGASDAVATAVAEQGGRVIAHGAHVLVELGPTLTTAGLFAICTSANVAVLELVPAVHAFA